MGGYARHRAEICLQKQCHRRCLPLFCAECICRHTNKMKRSPTNLKRHLLEDWMKKSLTSDMSLKLLTPSVSSLLAGPHPSVFCARTGGSQWISASTRQMSAVGRVDGTVVFVNALRGSVHIHAQGHSMYDVFSYSSLWSVVFWYHFQFPGLVQVRVKGSHSPHYTTLRASGELWDRRNGCPASFCWASYLKWGKASSPITQMISSDLKTSPSDVKIQVLSMGWTLGGFW